MWIFIALVLVVPLACKHVGSLSSNSNSEVAAAEVPLPSHLHLNARYN
jgi:hypothetical protein